MDTIYKQRTIQAWRDAGANVVEVETNCMEVAILFVMTELEQFCSYQDDFDSVGQGYTMVRTKSGFGFYYMDAQIGIVWFEDVQWRGAVCVGV